MSNDSTGALANAGLVPRGFAYIVDCVVAFGIFAATQLALFAPVREALGIGEEWFRSGVNTEVYTVLTISIPIYLYFALFEQSAWQATPGKRLLKLRVVDASSGGRIRFLQALLRTLVKLIPWEIAHVSNNLPEPIWYMSEPEFRLGFMAVGALMIVYVLVVGLHKKRQGPHDLISGTEVVKSGRDAV